MPSYPSQAGVGGCWKKHYETAKQLPSKSQKLRYIIGWAANVPNSFSRVVFFLEGYERANDEKLYQLQMDAPIVFRYI